MAPIPGTRGTPNARRAPVGGWDIVSVTAIAFGVIVSASLFFVFLKWLGSFARRFLNWLAIPVWCFLEPGLVLLKDWKRRYLWDSSQTRRTPDPTPEVIPLTETQALTNAVKANTDALERLITAMGNQASGSGG